MSCNRKLYLDYVRFLATLFVVCVHVVELAKVQLHPDTLAFRIAEVCCFIFLSCNLLFIMISGALLLPIKGERLRDFYVKRFSKVAIPFVVYYVIYVCAKEGIACLYPNYWLTFLQRIAVGAPTEAPHLWLIYVILGLYILTPFLRYLVQNISDEVLTGVVIVIFFVNALDTYLPLWSARLQLSGIVNTFAGVFVLGYYLSNRVSRRAEKLILTGGALALLMTVYGIFFCEGYEAYIYNNAPIMLLFASALFLGAKRLAEHFVFDGVLLRLVGRYSFSVMLIHWAVLHVAVKDILRVDVMSGGIVGGCVLAIVLTFILSLAGGICMEVVLIRPLQRLFMKIIDIPR